MFNKYHFTTVWRAKATVAEVYAVIDDAVDSCRWWPAVWLRAEVLVAGDSNGIGKQTKYLTKGWLPYLINWTGETIEKIPEQKIRLKAKGDFDGEGIWTFRQEGEESIAQFEWIIDGNKPLFKYFSLILKPIFKANHNWAMRKGQESLLVELQRRRATGKNKTPPQPTFLSAKKRRKLGLVTV